MQFYTYIHYLPDGNPFYVGKGYASRSDVKQKRNKIYNKLVRQFGMENIRVEIQLRESEEAALFYEKQIIAELRILGHKLVNRTSGGQGTSGMKHSEETKKIISEKHKGKKLSEETKSKISEAGKKRLIKYYPPKTPEAKERIIASRRGYKFTEEERRAHSERMLNRKPRTQETCDKISRSLKGKKHSPERIAKTRTSVIANYEKKRKLGISLAKTEQHRKNISAALKGHIVSEEHRKKQSLAMTGRKQSPESIAKQLATKRANREAKKLLEQTK